MLALLTGASLLVVGFRADDRQPAAVATSGAPLNILLITSDTTRRDALGCYGGNAATPNLDALAADGVVMDNAFSVAFGTTPSHSSLMAAAPAALHGVYDNATILGSGQTTLAERLRDAGYATAAFVSSTPLDKDLGLNQGFETYDDEFSFDAASGLGDFSHAERRADVTFGRFLTWLRGGPSKPFFAWIHVNDAHQPYFPPGTSDEGGPRYLDVKDALRERMQADPKFRDEFEANARDRYRREIEHIDRELGRAIGYLRENGLYDSTIIVFVSDHGENFGEHGLDLIFKHAALFSSVSQLPLILKLPGSEHRGTRSAALVGNLDIAPTLVDRLGLPPTPSWTGRSFREILDGSSDQFRLHLVLEGAEREEIAVRTPRFLYREVAAELRDKPDVLGYLGYAPGKPVEFYALESDPGEQVNRYPSPEADPLRAVAARFLAERRPVAVHRPDSPEHRERLMVLGYLH